MVSCSQSIPGRIVIPGAPESRREVEHVLEQRRRCRPLPGIGVVGRQRAEVGPGDDEYVGDFEPATAHLLVEPCRRAGDVGAYILEPERGAGLHQADVDAVESEQADELEDAHVLEQAERVVGARELHVGTRASQTRFTA